MRLVAAAITTAAISHFVLPTASEASNHPVVIYTMTISDKSSWFFADGLGTGREVNRLIIIYDTVTQKYGDIHIDNRRKLFTTDSSTLSFADVVDTTTASGTQYLTWSLVGPGHNNYWVLGTSPAGDWSSLETIRGKLRPIKVRTESAGLLEFDAPTILRGRRQAERVSGARDYRLQSNAKVTVRISKKLTTLVNREFAGSTLSEAEALIASYLLNRGWQFIAP